MTGAGRARGGAAAAGFLAAVLFTGCRNPFSPSAIVTIESLRAQGGASAGTAIFSVQASQAYTQFQNNVLFHFVQVNLRNYSSVDVLFTSFSVVYRDLFLNAPITALGGAGGLRFPITYTLGGFLVNTGSPPYGTGSVSLPVITPAFAFYIASTSTDGISGDANMASGGGADLEITLYGQDANGYDVRVSATMHVELF